MTLFRRMGEIVLVDCNVLLSLLFWGDFLRLSLYECDYQVILDLCACFGRCRWSRSVLTEDL